MNIMAETIIVSDVMEHLFCPRFTYFQYCLNIAQMEEKRFKVRIGRELHGKKEKTNTGYLRKKLGVVLKRREAYLSSDKYKVRGVVDEVLQLSDGTYAPLDYKFAEFKKSTYRTYKYQSVIYGLLIKENYNADVKKGFICYIRSNNLVKEINFTKRDFDYAIGLIDEILSIIQKGFYPKATSHKMRCIDCCYRRICV